MAGPLGPGWWQALWDPPPPPPLLPPSDLDSLSLMMEECASFSKICGMEGRIES